MDKVEAQFIEYGSRTKEELLPVLAMYMKAAFLLKQERGEARKALKDVQEVLQEMTEQDTHFRQVIIPDLQMTINKLMEEKADALDELQALKEEMITESLAGSKRPRGGGRRTQQRYIVHL